MNYFVTICVLALAASATSSGLGGIDEGLVYAPGHASVDYYSYPKYAFDYAVKDPHTGDNKAQWEKRDGDVVKGAYSLVEPDGSLRVVEYWADDKSGFHADVKRIGPSIHPTPIKYEPIYKAPIPILKEPIGISPLSIGPIGGIGKLAGAPLYGGYGVSSVSLLKEDIPIVKEIIKPIIKPYIPQPIIKPYISQPIIKPYISEPIYKQPLLEPYPLLKEPMLVKEPLLYKSPYLAKEPYLEKLPSYVKEPLGPYPLDIIGKEPLGYQGGLLPNLPYGYEGGHKPYYSNKYL